MAVPGQGQRVHDQVRVGARQAGRQAGRKPPLPRRLLAVTPRMGDGVRVAVACVGRTVEVLASEYDWSHPQVAYGSIRLAGILFRKGDGEEVRQTHASPKAAIVLYRGHPVRGMSRRFCGGCGCGRQASMWLVRALEIFQACHASSSNNNHNGPPPKHLEPPAISVVSILLGEVLGACSYS